MAEPPRRILRLRFHLIAFAVTRTIINTMYRMVYPFMTVFAQGLGVPITAMAGAVALRSGLGLTAPLLGSAADRRGRKRWMLLGLTFFVAGALLVVLRPAFAPFVAALLLTTVGKIVFDPPMQAHLGDRVGYEKRGQAIALTELGWSMAFLAGVPLMGWLIVRAGWAAPFPVLAGAGAAAALVLWRILPVDRAGAATGPSLGQGVRRILTHRTAIAGLLIGLLASAANETVNIVFGVWLEAAFSLRVAALGAAAAVIGVAELSGEGMVVALTDRVGKRRAVAFGLGANCVAALLLPVLAREPAGALLGLFLFYVSFEFTLVSTIPMMTELVPEARATLMSFNISALAIGRFLGAALGVALYPSGIRTNTFGVVLLNVLALTVLIGLLREVRLQAEAPSPPLPR
jgi:predicted MFS family arabinose efflux permease